MAELLFGTSIKRREDPRFITGKARLKLAEKNGKWIVESLELE